MSLGRVVKKVLMCRGLGWLAVGLGVSVCNRVRKVRGALIGSIGGAPSVTCYRRLLVRATVSVRSCITVLVLGVAGPLSLTDSCLISGDLFLVNSVVVDSGVVVLELTKWFAM